MEGKSNPTQQTCKGGCGFFGSPATDGLCSVCYKQNLKKEQQSQVSPPLVSVSLTVSGQATTSQSGVSNPTSTANSAKLTIPQLTTDQQESVVGNSSAAEGSVSSAGVDDSIDAKHTDKDLKKKKNRCATCRKKVGLTGCKCRCGGLFCALHRYSDKHDCTFDYRKMAAQEIERLNPLVVAKKVQKI